MFTDTWDRAGIAGRDVGLYDYNMNLYWMQVNLTKINLSPSQKHVVLCTNVLQIFRNNFSGRQIHYAGRNLERYYRKFEDGILSQSDSILCTEWLGLASTI